jgi:hypothetical protein
MRSGMTQTDEEENHEDMSRVTHRGRLKALYPTM